MDNNWIITSKIHISEDDYKKWLKSSAQFITNAELYNCDTADRFVNILLGGSIKAPYSSIEMFFANELSEMMLSFDKEVLILHYNKFSKTVKLNKDTSKMTEKQLIKVLKDKENNRYGIQEIYEINNFYNLLFLELYFILQEKTYLKKCKNCGKYFLTTNSAVIYCDNVFEDNKTCREIGANKVFTKNLEKDEAYNLYRKIYKKKQALAKSKGGNFEIEYNMFKYQGKDKKTAYKLKEISKEEFIKWLKVQ